MEIYVPYKGHLIVLVEGEDKQLSSMPGEEGRKCLQEMRHKQSELGLKAQQETELEVR